MNAKQLKELKAKMAEREKRGRAAFAEANRRDRELVRLMKEMHSALNRNDMSAYRALREQANALF